MKIKLKDIRVEYLNFLRNSDIFSTTIRGVTTLIDTFNAVAGDNIFTLTKTNCKNIRKVELTHLTDPKITLKYGRDYNIDLNTAKVTIYGLSINDKIDITYDYGGSDKIYSEYPRSDLTISSFPRIGFKIYNFSTAVAGFGNVLNSNWRFGVKVYATSAKEADDLIDAIRDITISNSTSLYYTYHMYPIDVLDLGPLDLEKGKTKIYVQGLNIMCDNNYEIN